MVQMLVHSFLLPTIRFLFLFHFSLHASIDCLLKDGQFYGSSSHNLHMLQLTSINLLVRARSQNTVCTLVTLTRDKILKISGNCIRIAFINCATRKGLFLSLRLLTNSYRSGEIWDCYDSDMCVADTRTWRN